VPTPSDTGHSKPSRKYRILHLSGDFPDSIEPSKTVAFRELIDLTADQFAHDVVSINRVDPSGLDTALELINPKALEIKTQPFEYGLALTYTAPGKGIRHETKLLQLGDWLANYIAAAPDKPDLIVGHKLTIEGIAVQRAAEKTGIAYALSIQGDSDTKIISARPDLTASFRSVLHGAEIVFPLAPWSWRSVTNRLGVPKSQPIMLPCPIALDQPIAPVKGNGLISVFHLQNYRRKNLKGLAKAVRLVEQERGVTSITVFGGGTEKDRANCQSIIATTPSITLGGPRSHEEMRTLMNQASALVLPSLRESFGMVFVEALFAGLPIIYPRNAAVDGYFDNVPFAIGTDARDPHAIANAMKQALDQELAMKDALAEWQQSDGIQIFQRKPIACAYRTGLEQAINSL